MRILLLILLSLECFAQGLTLRDPAFVASRRADAGSGEPSSLNTNLVAYWKLDETSGTRADSEPTGTAQNLTAEANSSWTFGKISNAAYFASLPSGWLWRSDSADLSGGDTDFTITAWYYQSAVVFGQMIVSKWGASAPDQEYLLHFQPNYFAFNISDGSSLDWVEAENGVVVSNAWYFLVAWHDSVNNEIGLSVNNGTPVTKAWTTGAADGSEGFTIGALDVAGTAYSIDASARVDEVGFYRKVLTAGEITELYAAGAGKTCCPFP